MADTHRQLSNSQASNSQFSNSPTLRLPILQLGALVERCRSKLHRQQFQRLQVGFGQTVDLVRDDVIAKEHQQRFTIPVARRPALEFVGVAGPAAGKWLILVVRLRVKSLGPLDPGQALRRPLVMAADTFVEMANELLRCDVDSQTINHVAPPSPGMQKTD